MLAFCLLLAPLGIATTPACTATTPLLARLLAANEIKNAADAATMRELQWLDEPLSSLEGIGCFPMLESVNIQNAGLSDVRPLAQLGKLRSLDLRRNRIEDISALAALGELRELRLGDNRIGDIAALSKLTHLSTLDLAQNRVHDLRGLVTKTQYVYLLLSDNRIDDLSPLAALDLKYLLRLELARNRLRTLAPMTFTSVQRLFVDLAGNQLSDLGPLADWHGLVSLDVSKNAVRSLEALADQTTLEALDVSENPIATLPKRGVLDHLSRLRLERTNITDLTPLQERLPKDAELHLFPSKICDLSPIIAAGLSVSDAEEKDVCACPARLSFPAGVDCSEESPMIALAKRGGAIKCRQQIAALDTLFVPTEAKSLDGIQCFSGLTRLDLENRALSDLRPLASLKRLKSLNLRRNRLSELSPLSGLVQLETLELGENRLRNVDALRPLFTLTVLGLEQNELDEVAALSGLLALRELQLAHNRISDATPLAALPQLQRVDLAYNRVRDFAPLRRAGRDVLGTERQYRGSCLAILQAMRAQRPRPAQDAICPEWEDTAVSPLLPASRQGCRAERICGDIIGVDCHSAADGPYDYFDLRSWRLLSACGGACMGGPCKSCPPAEMHCSAQ